MTASLEKRLEDLSRRVEELEEKLCLSNEKHFAMIIAMATIVASLPGTKELSKQAIFDAVNNAVQSPLLKDMDRMPEFHNEMLRFATIILTVQDVKPASPIDQD